MATYEEIGPNKGNIAEGLVGAALFAKFINRPKDKKKEYPTLTKQMVEDVLTEYYKGIPGHTMKKTVADTPKGLLRKKIKDNMMLKIDVPEKDLEILRFKKNRSFEQIQDIYESAIKYVEETWESDAMEFARNGEVDEVIVNSDGVGDQKGTKADIKVTHNGKPYRRQISLKVSGGDQFAQVSGEDFSKQIKIWENLNVDVSSLESKYNKLFKNINTDMVFESRENKKLNHIKDVMKSAADLVYRFAAKDLQNKFNTKNNKLYDILAELIFNSATLGDESIELVKLENGFKRISFSNDFKKKYSQRLKQEKLIVKYREGGDPLVIIYVGSESTKNKLIQIRVKVESPSKKKDGKKVYSPYMRNYIEAGNKMFELAEELEN